MILDKAAAVLKKDFLTAIRYRNGLVLSAVAPTVQLATFYYLSRSVGPQFRPEGMPYFLFLLIGTGLFTFLLAGMHSFLHIIQECQQTGTIEVLMTTATPPAALLVLSAMSAYAAGAVQLLLYVGGGIVIFRPAIQIHWLPALLVLVCSIAVCVAIGIFAAALQVLMHKGTVVLWLFGSSAWVLAGTLFPIGALPRPVQMLSQLLPLTHSLSAMRMALSPSRFSSLLGHEIAILLLFSAALLPLSVGFFSWTVRRARQYGTLSFY
jgi:ABC-2 type transport system permease protein